MCDYTVIQTGLCLLLAGQLTATVVQTGLWAVGWAVLWLETKKTKKNSVELETSLFPAEAEVGAVAKADQKLGLDSPYPYLARAHHCLLGVKAYLEISGVAQSQRNLHIYV